MDGTGPSVPAGVYGGRGVQGAKSDWTVTTVGVGEDGVQRLLKS